MSKNRLVIVSNRLPVTIACPSGGQPIVKKSSGGLVSGLSEPHLKSGGLWVGWPGSLSCCSEEQRASIFQELAEMKLHPIELSDEEIKLYYDGFSNSVLWPLFHYRQDQVPHTYGEEWNAYVNVNRKFAEAIAALYQEGDHIWVHDYQLFLVPAFLRELVPDAIIGLFLHIPFPSTDLFKTLSSNKQLLEGALGADLIGFQTAAYMRNFSSSVLRILGLPYDVLKTLEYGDRFVKFGIYPISIDTGKFSGPTTEEMSKVQLSMGWTPEKSMKIFLGVDRLDYTKGITRRLMSFDRMLSQHPELHGKVKFIQVAVPTRDGVNAYQKLQKAVESITGHINGKYATLEWTPITYMHKSVSPMELLALYRAADVMLVTPLRDGMNLVAKEFVTSRIDNDGVLVLSEFAGAASELGESVLVNPYDIDQMAEGFYKAITMSEKERKRRIQTCRKRVMTYDVHVWTSTFLSDLGKIAEASQSFKSGMTSGAELTAVVQKIKSAKKCVFLLDYDGTLCPIVDTPEIAAPNENLLNLLRSLSEKFEVHLVSGRSKKNLKLWFAQIEALGLQAENGVWSRAPNAKEWISHDVTKPGWWQPVIDLMTTFCLQTPGSWIEMKTVDVVWHYRLADAEFGSAQAHELHDHLQSLFGASGVEIIQGKKNIEVRPFGVHKGKVVTRVVPAGAEDTLVVAIGDDRTDEDMFENLPVGSVSIHVGGGASAAKGRLPDWTSVHRFLRMCIGQDANGVKSPMLRKLALKKSRRLSYEWQFAEEFSHPGDSDSYS